MWNVLTGGSPSAGDLAAIRKQLDYLCSGERDKSSEVEVLLNKYSDSIQEIIQLTDSYENSPLHTAAKAGHVNIVDLLIKKGADIRAKNGEGYTPLHLACANGHTDVATALINAPLFVKDYEINRTNNAKNTPLHLAAKAGNLELVKLLIENNARIVIGNQKEQTPLHLACTKGHLEIAKALYTKDGEIKPNAILINRKDNKGKTAADLAAKNKYPKLAEQLKKAMTVTAKYGAVKSAKRSSLAGTVAGREGRQYESDRPPPVLSGSTSTKGKERGGGRKWKVRGRSK